MRASPSESEIQSMIIRTLRSMGHMAFKHNPVNFTPYGFGKVAAIDKGIADVIACVNGKYVEFEIKCKTGKQSNFQKAHEKLVNKCGGKYFVIKSLEDLSDALNNI